MSDLPTPAPRSFLSAISGFKSGDDSPREFLERCVKTIEDQDAAIGAFVTTNFDAARQAADESGLRWKSGSQLSAIDGMPVGIKDIMETHDMGTEQGSDLFIGWKGGRDSAAAAGLREAGAVLIGKTVTTEFASTHPGKTRNPWDLERTPGGSSSGSAASVAAGMVPAALGTQVIGSILRPAGYCGVYGFKPSFGGINRGGSFDGFSQSSSGVLAATLAEAWCVGREISTRVGGDPGYLGIVGPMEPPAAVKPRRIAMLETAGWEVATDDAKQALMSARETLQSGGIEIADRTSDDAIAAAEDAIADAMTISMSINAWEGRWPLNTYARDMDRSKLSDQAQSRLAQADGMSQEEYQRLHAERIRIREVYENLAGAFDLCVSLTAPGAAPKGLDWTGDPLFVVPGSLLGIPTISLPLLTAEDDMPLGLQLLGYMEKDAELFASAAGILPLFA
ncbi:MAG: amidase [Pseudomonadota bacterium]|nr:amidase [Pseudomonadota bacterium]